MVVSPKIMIQYATAFPPVLCSEDIKGNDLIEFSKNLIALRKTLSCGVCQKLMTNRTALVASTCREHFVCSECRGGNRKESDKCNKCEDWSVFEEDEALSLMLQSYQTFCYSLLTSDQFTRLLEVKHEVDPKFDAMGLIELLGEGMKGCKVQRKSNRAFGNATGVVPVTVVPRRKPTDINRDGMRAQLENAKANDLNSVDDIAARADGEAMDDDAEDADDEISVVNSTARRAKAKPRVQRSRSKPTCNTQEDSQQQKDLRTLEPVAALPSSPVPHSSNSSAERNAPSQTRKSKSVDEDDKEKDEVFILPDRNSRESTPSQSQSPSPSISGSPSKIATSTATPTHAILKRVAGGKFVLVDPTMVVTTTAGPSASTPSNFPVMRMVTSTGVSGVPFAKNQINVASLPPQIMTALARSTSPIIQVSHSQGGMVKGVPIRLSGTSTVQLPSGQFVQIISSSQPASSSTANTTQANSAPSYITVPSNSSSSSSSSVVSVPGPSLPPNPPVKRRVFVPTTSISLAEFRSKCPDPGPSQIRGADGAAGYGQNLVRGRPFAPGSVSVRPPRPTGPVVVGTTAPTPVVSTVSQNSQVQNVPLAVSTSPTTYASRQYTVNHMMMSNVGPGPSNVSQSKPGQPMLIDAPTLGQNLNPDQNLASVNQGSIIAQGSNLGVGVGGIVYSTQKKSDCKCGSGTSNPGNLTCIGQRCVCYANRNACLYCKCKGCKNPYIPGTDAKRMLHNVRTVPISDSLNQSQSIQFVAASPVPIGSGNATAAMFTGNQGIATSNPPLMANIGGGIIHGNFSTIGNDGSNMQQQPPGSTVYLRMPMSSVGLNPSAGSAHQFIQFAGQGFPIFVQQGGGGPLLQAPQNTGYTFQGQGLPIPVSSIAGIHPNAGFPVAQIPAPRPGIPQPQQLMTLQQPQGPMDIAPPPQENRRQ